jgi:four helix bundle protein
MDNAFRARLYAFTLRLIAYVRSLPADFVSRRMGDQLFRSGTSIIANMTEGGSAASRRDYATYANHALKSANETHLWLSLLQDSGLRTTESAWLIRKVAEISRILAATLMTLRRTLRDQSKRSEP